MDRQGEYTFGELLRKFRVRKDITQQELADRLHVHRNTIVAWEKGNGLPKVRTMVEELAKALRLSD